MSSFHNNQEFQNAKNIQSFYEPALKILSEMMEVKIATLQKRNHNIRSAMVSKVEFVTELARRLRISQWNAQQIISSLVKSNSVIASVGFVKPKAGEA